MIRLNVVHVHDQHQTIIVHSMCKQVPLFTGLNNELNNEIFEGGFVFGSVKFYYAVLAPEVIP